MTTRMPTPPDTRKVIVGVDTHKYVHVAVAIDSWGIRLRDEAFVADLPLEEMSVDCFPLVSELYGRPDR